MKQNGLAEKARKAYENNLALVTIIGVLVGFNMWFWADPHPHSDLPKLALEVVKEMGGFILATFLAAFLYEAVISYRSKEEFRRELQEALRQGFQGGIKAVHPRRPTISYKAQKLRETHDCFIELGVAINTFKEYVIKNQTTDIDGSSGYRDILVEKMQHGLKVTCLMLDPDVASSGIFKEVYPGLESKIRNSITELKPFQAEMNAKYPGKFEIRFYRAIPTFSCMAFDCESGGAGQLILSPYVFNLENASTPAFEIHQRDSPVIFAVYQRMLLDLRDASQPLT